MLIIRITTGLILFVSLFRVSEYPLTPSFSFNYRVGNSLQDQWLILLPVGLSSVVSCFTSDVPRLSCPRFGELHVRHQCPLGREWGRSDWFRLTCGHAWRGCLIRGPIYMEPKVGHLYTTSSLPPTGYPETTRSMLTPETRHVLLYGWTEVQGRVRMPCVWYSPRSHVAENQARQETACYPRLSPWVGTENQRWIEFEKKFTNGNWSCSNHYQNPTPKESQSKRFQRKDS